MIFIKTKNFFNGSNRVCDVWNETLLRWRNRCIWYILFRWLAQNCWISSCTWFLLSLSLFLLLILPKINCTSKFKHLFDRRYQLSYVNARFLNYRYFTTLLSYITSFASQSLSFSCFSTKEIHQITSFVCHITKNIAAC